MSDHGMETITIDKFIYLNQYLSNNTQKIILTGPNAFVLPNAGENN